MRARRLSCLLAFVFVSCGGASTPPEEPTTPATFAERYEEPVTRIATASREADFAWAWLETLCGDIGHRLSGSESLERAVQWSAEELRGIDGVEVELQPVEVVHWVRGAESLHLLGDEEEELAMVGLGNSVGTDGEPLEGEVVVLTSMEELETRAEDVDGKIVLFDVPMPDYDAETLTPGYGEVVGIRVGGPSAVAAAGGVAMLLRSLTNDASSPPHTGMTRYAEEGPRIPAAAITVPDAERIHQMVDAGQTVRVRLRMEARDEGTATSHNVIATLPGTDPSEIVVFGGHMDSWDVGQGCHDDGSGVVSAMAALRLVRELGLTPRRSMRAVLWTNEENGLGGARAYAEEHYSDATHVAGLESDIGAAPVVALGVETEDHHATPEAIARIERIVQLLEPVGVTRVKEGWSGADVSPLVEMGMPGVAIVHDPAHYFDLHHTSADTIEAVDRDAFLQGIAAMTATAYVLADMDERLAD